MVRVKSCGQHGCNGKALRSFILFALAALVTFASFGPASAQSPDAKSATRVYLFRGFMNVFSLGMDELGTQLTRQGISNEVYNHVLWNSAAEDAIQQYKSGRVRTIVIVGHSMGVSAVISMVGYLAEQNIPVALAVTLDGSPTSVPTAKIGRFVNLYISTGSGGPFTQGPHFSGHLVNIDVAKFPDIGHLNIDKQAAIHKMVFGYISQAMAATRHPATPNAGTRRAGSHPKQRAAPASAPGSPAAQRREVRAAPPG